MKLVAITPREASIFACAADALLAPEPGLPPVRETTTAQGFDAWLAASPALNRIGVRVGLHVLELAPLFTRGHRLRALTPSQRRDFLATTAKSRVVWAAVLVDTLRMLAAASYYGDDRVAMQLGYDADARVERGRKLRAAEGRP